MEALLGATNIRRLQVVCPLGVEPVADNSTIVLEKDA
jgi:hypothetical protein